MLSQGLALAYMRYTSAKGIQFHWRWDDGTISTKLCVIWGMSAQIPDCTLAGSPTHRIFNLIRGDANGANRVGGDPRRWGARETFS